MANQSAQVYEVTVFDGEYEVGTWDLLQEPVLGGEVEIGGEIAIVISIATTEDGSDFVIGVEYDV
jgi:hypothetical protein